MSQKRMLQSCPAETIVLLSSQAKRVIWLWTWASEGKEKREIVLSHFQHRFFQWFLHYVSRHITHHTNHNYEYMLCYLKDDSAGSSTISNTTRVTHHAICNAGFFHFLRLYTHTWSEIIKSIQLLLITYPIYNHTRLHQPVPGRFQSQHLSNRRNKIQS